MFVFLGKRKAWRGILLYGVTIFTNLNKSDLNSYLRVIRQTEVWI